MQESTKTTSEPIRFYLNNDLVETIDLNARDTLLEYLRTTKKLTGTKEGCGEGDCGACTVLIGRLSAGNLKYETVNACICLMPSVDGCHVITIEFLSMFNVPLHPIQNAIVKNNGSQCGFCTPGIVMSLYGLWLNSNDLTDANIERNLQGNLCRCTGYNSIVLAAKALNEYGKLSDDALYNNTVNYRNNLMDLSSEISKFGGDRESYFYLPKTLNEFEAIYEKNPNATLVAGSTDVGLWITKELSTINPLIFIGHLQELKQVKEFDDGLEIGACMSYSEAQPILVRYFPVLQSYFLRIAGEQVRNMGTLGGNIANGSPIGDMAPILIALRAKIILVKNGVRRSIMLEDFFLDYGKQDLGRGEFIEKIFVPINKELTLYAYKLSKRRDEDITIVSAAISVKSENCQIRSPIIAFGGMAGIPKRALAAENVIEGRKLDELTVKLAGLALEEEFTPLSDARASADYRIMVAKNLLRKFYLEYEGQQPVTINREI